MRRHECRRGRLRVCATVLLRAGEARDFRVVQEKGAALFEEALQAQARTLAHSTGSAAPAAPASAASRKSAESTWSASGLGDIFGNGGGVVFNTLQTLMRSGHAFGSSLLLISKTDL